MTYEEGEAWLDAHGFDEVDADCWSHFNALVDVRAVRLANGEIMWGAMYGDTEEFGSDPESALARLSDQFVSIRAGAEEAIQVIAEIVP